MRLLTRTACRAALRRPSTHSHTASRWMTSAAAALRTVPQQQHASSDLPDLSPATSRALLTDRFGRHHTYLRVSLTERCNLRCQYCMPAEGIDLTDKQQLLSTDELQRLLLFFVQRGITKLRFTGGEPLVRQDLPSIIQYASDVSKQLQGSVDEHLGLQSIGITTNGVTLNARKLSTLVSAGLTHINISLDTLDEWKFIAITRRNGHSKVVQNIHHAVDYMLQNPHELRCIKLNVVLMRGINDNEVAEFVEMTRTLPIEVRFIEYMPFDGNRWSNNKFIGYKEVLGQLMMKHPELYSLPLDANHTSKLYKMTPQHAGTVGFITSMSEHFCNTCNRIRLTADGNLKVCLFGNSEISLRDAIRQGATDQDISALLSEGLSQKRGQHAADYEHAFDSDAVHLPRRSNDTRLSAAMLMSTPWFARSVNYAQHMQWPMMRRYAHCTSSRRSSTPASPSTPTPATLSHVDESLNPTMVDVTHKQVTSRQATAQAQVWLPKEVLQAVQHTQQQQQGSQPASEVFSKKGPVFQTAIIAGTMAVKQTHTLIPFCHPLQITKCKFHIRWQDANEQQQSPDGGAIVLIDCTVGCQGQTGVEMEAIVGCSIAATTIYDMLKAASHNIQIKHVKLLQKSGGKSDFTQK